MPKYSSVASITTLWENNPDTPITAANLSRLQDLTVSYLNTDDESFGIHVEGSILYPHPTDSKFVILKRGTIIQIINESVDMIGNPIIPKNSMYRIFDVGLEDIILTYADTDETQLNKTTWGTGNNEWFIFLCDKDDSTLYNKGTPDAYGGGAQILISKYSDYPRGQIPGRPAYTYSSKDVRLIGGFKTNNNNIISSSIWDIAGKYNNVKAKAYYILDEYKTGGAEYRKIQLSDLNTSIPSKFNSNVDITGNLNITQNLNAENLIAKNTTFNGIMSQTGNVNIIGNITVNGTTNLINKLTTGQVDILGNTLVDSILTIKRGTNIAVFDSTINFTAPIIHSGNYNLTGNLTQTGILSQSGNVALGGSGRTVSFTGATTVNGNTTLQGDLVIPSIDGLKTLFNVNRDTQQITVNANGLVLNSEVQINDKFGINSGTQDITLYTTRNILSSVGSTYEWKNTGNLKVDNGIFTVQQNSSNKVFEVLPTNQINTNAAFSAVIPSGKTFTVKNHLGNTILGVEHDITLPSEKRVAINTVLDLSASSADNALRVTGNGRFTGDLTVDGILYADIQGSVVGGASSWTNNLTINLTGDVGGQVTFKGNEGSINLITQVYDDSHTHDTRYYTETELQTSGSAFVHWSNISNKPATYPSSPHTHDIYLEDSEITWALLQSRGLVGSTGTDLGNQDVLARIDHKHDSLYSHTSHNHNSLYAPIGNYAVIGNNVSFSDITSTTVSSTDINVSGGLNVFSTNGINFKQNALLTGNTYKLYSSTDGTSLMFNGIRVITSTNTNNIAPSATQLATPQTLSFIANNGISSSTVTGQIGGGGSTIQVGLTLDAVWIATRLMGTGLTTSSNLLNVNFGTSSNQAARGNHGHNNDSIIGGPYALDNHTHSEYTNYQTINEDDDNPNNITTSIRNIDVTGNKARVVTFNANETIVDIYNTLVGNPPLVSYSGQIVVGNRTMTAGITTWNTNFGTLESTGKTFVASIDTSANVPTSGAVKTYADTNFYTKTQLDVGQLDNRYYTETEINANIYTKTQMQTAGSSQLHWDNIASKPTTFSPSTHTHTFTSLTDKPTTISGFGITNAYTKTEVYTKAEVQNFIEQTMVNIAKSFGRSTSSSLPVPGEFINPTTGSVITY